MAHDRLALTADPPATIDRLGMNHRTCASTFTLALALTLVPGFGDAAAVPACLSAAAASAASVAPGASTTGSGCDRRGASITPADGKEPIENPHRLGWQEWTFLAATAGSLGLLAAGVIRLS